VSIPCLTPGSTHIAQPALPSPPSVCSHDGMWACACKRRGWACLPTHPVLSHASHPLHPFKCLPTSPAHPFAHLSDPSTGTATCQHIPCLLHPACLPFLPTHPFASVLPACILPAKPSPASHVPPTCGRVPTHLSCPPTRLACPPRCLGHLCMCPATH